MSLLLIFIFTYLLFFIIYFSVIFSVLSLCIYTTLLTYTRTQLIHKTFLYTPRNIKVSHSSDPTVVNIFWSPPEEPNGKITGYDILYTDILYTSDRKWKREKVNGEITTIVLTKLIPDSKYFLKIKARIDDRELGPPSDVIEFIANPSSPHSHTALPLNNYPTLLASSFLNSPRNIKVWHSSDPTLVVILWSPPEEPNGKIFGYEILYTDILYTSDKKWRREEVIGEKTTIVLNKLIPYSKYFLKIKARIDDRELGPPSDVIEFIANPSSPHSHTSSSKAKILEVVPGRDSSKAEITWRAPQEPKGRIKRYEIYYISDEKIKQNAEWNVKVIEYIKEIDDINDVKQIRASIYGLLPNTNYKFWIKVKTSEDNVGSTSSIFEFLTEPLINKNKNYENFLNTNKNFLNTNKNFLNTNKNFLNTNKNFLNNTNKNLFWTCVEHLYTFLNFFLDCVQFFGLYGLSILICIIVTFIVIITFIYFWYFFIYFFFWTCVKVFGLFGLCIYICSLKQLSENAKVLICVFCLITLIYLWYFLILKSKQYEAEQKRTKKNNENTIREGLTI